MAESTVPMLIVLEMCIRDSSNKYHASKFAKRNSILRIIPVSYTHLDVYKRQIYTRIPANRKKSFFKDIKDRYAVSYTHLDVYKRQASI